MAEEQWNPGRLMRVSGAYWESFPLHVAVYLDVFTLIGENSLSAEEIAAKWRANERGVRSLLDAVAAMGLLEKKAGKYSNNEAAKTFLIKTSPAYIGFAIKHHHHLVSAWSKLSQSVKTGKPVRKKKTNQGRARKLPHGHVQQRFRSCTKDHQGDRSFSKATSSRPWGRSRNLCDSFLSGQPEPSGHRVRSPHDRALCPKDDQEIWTELQDRVPGRRLSSRCRPGDVRRCVAFTDSSQHGAGALSRGHRKGGCRA